MNRFCGKKWLMGHILRACLCTVSIAEQGSSKLSFILFKINFLDVFISSGKWNVEGKASSTLFNKTLAILKLKFTWEVKIFLFQCLKSQITIQKLLRFYHHFLFTSFMPCVTLAHLSLEKVFSQEIPFLPAAFNVIWAEFTMLIICIKSTIIG